MVRDARRISPPRLVPLPAQALDRLETQFDPETQGIPTHPNRLRRVAGQYDPGFRLLGAPDYQQSAAAFGGALEGGSAAHPRGVGAGNESLGGQPPASRSAEGDVFGLPDVGMPARSLNLVPQFGTGQARSHSTITVTSWGTAGARARSNSTIGSIQAPGRLAGRMRQATGIAHPR